MNKLDIRSILLEIVCEKNIQILKDPSMGGMQQNSILQDVQERLGWSQSPNVQQAILTYWYDLFRNGMLSWGHNLTNPNPPFFHVTDIGRKVLENISRDPSNPDGYIAFLNERTNLDPISFSYIEEALKTYNSDCIKASSVMVGAAAERLVLTIQSSLLFRMESIEAKIPKSLKDWRIKKILKAIESIIRERKKRLPNTLFESFEAYWPAFTHQIRTVRNESGHPVSIQPVTPETVHASLLIFPEMGILSKKLQSWIENDMNE